MPRVASLYLPNLSTDRVRASEREGRRSEARGSAASLTLPMQDVKEGREPCSCPRGGHWRPGARWAQKSSPARSGGEGDHAKHGGGVTGEAQAVRARSSKSTAAT